MTATIAKPTLGQIRADDLHTRTVEVQLADAEPIATGRYRTTRGNVDVEIRFQPRRLRLAWSGTPARLTGVYISGPELTKSGSVNARHIITGHNYLIQDVEWGRDPETGRHHRFITDSRLAEDTPDWIRELIAQYAPDWPELEGPGS